MKIISKRRLAPLTLVAFALAGGALSVRGANAQNGTNLSERTQKRFAALFGDAQSRVRDLQLSAGQQTKLRAIAQKNVPLARAALSDKSLSPAQKNAKLRAFKSETEAVFSAAQKQKLAAGKTEAMGQLFSTAAWVSNELSLTATQQEQIQRIVMSSYGKSRQTQGDFGALRSLMEETDGQIQNVLAPSQKAKWNVIKAAARAEIVKNTRVWRMSLGI